MSYTVGAVPPPKRGALSGEIRSAARTAGDFHDGDCAEDVCTPQDDRRSGGVQASPPPDPTSKVMSMPRRARGPGRWSMADSRSTNAGCEQVRFYGFPSPLTWVQRDEHYEHRLTSARPPPIVACLEDS